MTELIVSVLTNAVLLSLLLLAMKAAKSDRELFRAVNEQLLKMLSDSRVSHDRERQKLLDRIQATDTEDYAVRRNIALSEEDALNEEGEPAPEPGWRDFARRHHAFSELADLIEIEPGGDDEPDMFWIPQSNGYGYTLSMSEFFKKISYYPPGDG